ncbi:hypothetical protein QJS10_CPB15g00488 [Acorus calamus]|uniref:Uncharacterized protein n=1 Tax=Acorus calamus TaxID=4465 RepID=A0AAV9D7Y5_ACOCL|nr:hypothetical protein QJS10_CPB15g00488 [Acorus calamus]
MAADVFIFASECVNTEALAFAFGLRMGLKNGLQKRLVYQHSLKNKLYGPVNSKPGGGPTWPTV